MFKKVENFLAQRGERWFRILLLSLFFALGLCRLVSWVWTLDYVTTLGVLLAIGLVADFVALVVKQPS